FALPARPRGSLILLTAGPCEASQEPRCAPAAVPSRARRPRGRRPCVRHGCRHRPDGRAGLALGHRGSRPGSLPVLGIAPWGEEEEEEEEVPVSKRDKARNTAQAAKGKTKRAAGKAAG